MGYVLMNPLSACGRGVKSQGRLVADGAKMRAIHVITERFRERGLDLTHIWFPNDDKPLGGCDIGKLIYVFADGQLAVCPYIVFAARTPQSKYPDTEFPVANIFRDEVGRRSTSGAAPRRSSLPPVSGGRDDAFRDYREAQIA